MGMSARRQPQGLVRINRSIGWANRLAFLVSPGVGGVPLDVANGRFADINPLSRKAFPQGVGYTNANASTGARLAGAAKLTTSTGDGLGDFTVFVVAAPNASTTRQMPYSNSKAGGAEMYFVFNAGVSLAASSGAFTLATNAGGAFGLSVAGAVDGKPHVFLATRRAGVLSLYVDGVLKGTGAHTSPTWSSGNWDNICGYTNTGWGTLEPVALIGGVNKALTDGEIAGISANPWLIVDDPSKAQARTVTAGATDTPVNPGAGALTLTGFAPTVAQSVNQGVTPVTGALSLTGYAPTVTQSSTTSILPQPDALTLTGYAPTVTRTAGQQVQPFGGSLTLTGYAPTVTRTTSQAVSPAPAALVLTGYPPLITQGPDNAPRVYATTIMRITTTNRRADLGAVLNAAAPIRSTGPNVATIMSPAPVNRAADLGPATLNRTVSFP